VVEDDAEVVEQVGDTLCSIRHDFHWVVTQQDARKALETEDFDYVLLDLEIPAKSPKGKPSKEFGANVLADIRRIKRDRRPPVIVMSGHVGHCLNHSNELRERGATQFIAKPFPTEDRTLASVIRDVLATHEQQSAQETSQAGNGKSRSFRGGEMVFFQDRVELLGVEIISDRGLGQTMLVLNKLRRKDADGNYVRLSGEELAKAIGARGGLGTITGCIRGLRRNISIRLQKQRGVKAAKGDVNHESGGGYGDKCYVVLTEFSDEFGLVIHRPRQAIERADNDAIHHTGLHVGEEPFQRRSLHRGT